MNLLPLQWRLRTRICCLVAAALAAIAGCSRYQQEPGKVTPEGEEHVRALIQTLPVNSDMRRTLEEGGRGPGVHYPWMDAMKHQGVQQAEVRLVFSVPFRIPHIWSGRPGKLTVVRVLYFEKYDRDCSQIMSADRLAAFRSSGLEQQLQEYAKEQARNARWFVFEHPIPNASHGGSDIRILDDEWLPRDPTFLFPARDKDDPFLSDAMLVAIVAGDEMEVDRILASGKTSATSRNQVIIEAAMGNNSCIVKDLLRSGADANFRNESGETPLMYAAEAGQINNVKALLEFGARIDQRSSGGETALSRARYRKHADIVELLERRQANH